MVVVLLSHLLLVFGDHLVEAAAGAVAFLVESLLESLLFRLVEVPQLGELLLALLMDVFYGQLVVALLVLDFTLEVFNLLLELFVHLLDNLTFLRVQALGVFFEAVSFLFRDMKIFFKNFQLLFEVLAAQLDAKLKLLVLLRKLRDLFVALVNLRLESFL